MNQRVGVFVDAADDVRTVDVVNRDRGGDGLERSRHELTPTVPAEIGEDVVKAALEILHALMAELGHFLRAILANRCGVGKAFEQKFGQRAVAGAEVQDRNRLLFVVGNRVRYGSESFLTIGFL